MARRAPVASHRGGAWRLEERADIRRVLDPGVDVFTSDHPVTALAMRD